MSLKRALFGVTILVLSLCLVADAQSNKNNRQRQRDQETQSDRTAMREIGASNIGFSLDLYKVLARAPGNVFFSPLSAHSILTMLSLGARENTLEQLKHGLHLPAADNVAEIGYRTLNKAFKSTVDKGVTIKVANKVYATTSSPLTAEFKKTTIDHFSSSAENVDFGNSEKVRNDINQWVENNTNKKITDLIPSGTLSSETAMVLVNAVYFKGKWLTEFDPANSTDGEFNGIKGPERVRFMETTSEFAYHYSRKLNAKSMELSYNGDKISMVIILPLTRNEFDKMEELLTTSDPREFIPGQDDKFNVHVKIPKFRLDKSTPLSGPLAELGMTDMFGNSADLSGLASGGPPLKVSKVLHKAFVEVNEEGSEAAATTVLAVQTLSLNSDDNRAIDFIADQPFIFMIRHKASGTILFMGRYTSPSGDEGAEAPRPVQQRPSAVLRPTSPPKRPAGGSGNNNQGSGRQTYAERTAVRSGPASTTSRMHFEHETDQGEMYNRDDK